MKEKDLKHLDKSHLIELLLALCTFNKDNAAFLKSKLALNHDDLFVLCAKKIDSAFSSFRNRSLKNARNSLMTFKKSQPEDYLFVELCLHYIQKAYDLNDECFFDDENFYSAVEKVYDMIFNLLANNDYLKEQYMSTLEKLVERAIDGFGHKNYVEEGLEEIQ